MEPDPLKTAFLASQQENLADGVPGLTSFWIHEHERTADVVRHLTKFLDQSAGHDDC